MEDKIMILNNSHPKFYLLLGKYLANREVFSESGGYCRDDRDKKWIVFIKGCRVAGFCSIHQNWIKNLYVIKEFRGKGIAGELAVANKNSAKLFARMGFVEKTKTKNFTKMEKNK